MFSIEQKVLVKLKGKSIISVTENIGDWLQVIIVGKDNLDYFAFLLPDIINGEVREPNYYHLIKQSHIDRFNIDPKYLGQDIWWLKSHEILAVKPKCEICKLQ